MPRINFLFVLIILLTACSPEVVASPTPITLSAEAPTATALPTNTPTEAPTELPPTATELPVTPEQTEGMLTYKNTEGVEVTVELAKYAYTNKKGELMEIVQPPDRMAILKLLADRSKWYPADTDHKPVNESIGTDEALHELLAQYDISWPPKGIQISAYPWMGFNPFMPVFTADWDGGTIIVGQKADGSYFEVFYPGDPSEFLNSAILDPETPEYKYLHELAAAHQ